MTDSSSLPVRVLLLSESEAFAGFDKRALREAGVQDVQCLTSGVAAARALAKACAKDSPLPVVISSHKLSDMDGERFCAIVRLHPLLRTLPVLLILSSKSEAEQLKMLGCGASALLWRPYSIDALTARLVFLEAARRGEIRRDKTEGGDTRDFDDALATCGMLLKPVRQPEDFFQAGMRCLRQEQWSSAISAFQHAMRGDLAPGKAELGMALAWKGRGDQVRYRQYLADAAAIFVQAQQWQRARAACMQLFQADAAAKNPFLALAIQHLGQGDHDGAAEILSQGLEVTPRAQVSERIALFCMAADDPQALLHALTAGLEKRLGAQAHHIGDEIREALHALAQERETRKRKESAEKNWRASRQAQIAAGSRGEEKRWGKKHGGAGAPTERVPRAETFLPARPAPVPRIPLWEEPDGRLPDGQLLDDGENPEWAQSRRRAAAPGKSGEEGGTFAKKRGDLFQIIRHTWMLSS